MKRIILLTIIILTLSLTLATASAQQTGSSISIDGKLVEFTSSSGYPFLDENSRTQVPFRVTLETFGATINWEQSTRTAIAEKDGIRVEVPIGEKYIIVNGKRVENDTAALIVGSKTYLPIRKVMEAFGAEVKWDDKSKTVSIISRENPKHISNQINSVGNTTENIRNGGLIASQGEWLYFSNIRDDNKLYKMHKNNHELIKLSDQWPAYINVIGEWVYYSSSYDRYAIYKIKTDGSNLTKLHESWSTYLTVIDNWMYFKSGEKICKMKTDGSGYTILAESSSFGNQIFVNNGFIYTNTGFMINASNGKVDLLFNYGNDNRLKRIIADKYKIVGDWIYYINAHYPEGMYGLFKMKKDFTQNTRLTNRSVSDFQVVGDWIYFESENFYKIKTDGSKETLIDVAAPKQMHVIDDWIYGVGGSPTLYYYPGISHRINVSTGLNEFLNWEELTVGSTPKEVLSNKTKLKNLGIEKDSKLGNTMSNIANYAMVAKEGDWIYYINPSDNDKIYKMHTNGTGRVKLNNTYTSQLNVVGEWIYCIEDIGNSYNGDNTTQIVKISTDGKKRIIIPKHSSLGQYDRINWLVVADGWIYYTSVEGILYRVKTDGSNSHKYQLRGQSQLEAVREVNIAGDWIYYRGSDYRLYRMKTDGSTITKLNDEFTTYFIVDGNWIYYNKKKMKVDGTDVKDIMEEDFSKFIVSGEWIYYTKAASGNESLYADNELKEFYKVKIDGTQKEKLLEDYVRHFWFAGEWIYYYNHLGMYRVLIDGTGKEPVK